jgi:hypothetical protein
VGLKRSAIGNTPREHIGNLKRTYWQQSKNEKNPPPTQNLKENKIKAL